jgi:uncharacterized protein
MFLSVREMEVRKVSFDETYPPDSIQFLDRKLRQAGPMHAIGTAELVPSSDGELRVRGHLDVAMEAECDLCLETASYPVALDFDLFYAPAADGPEGEEIALGAEDSDVDFYQGDGVELENILREQVLLALPMQRLCREDCRGICPVCGENRNRVQCGCRPTLPDDRWAALRSL